jgi:hypothetical protein
MLPNAPPAPFRRQRDLRSTLDGWISDKFMLYKITVPVEGSLFLESGAVGCAFSSGASDLSYALRADANGRVVAATIQAKVPTDKVSAFVSTFGPGEGSSKLSVTLGGDKELYERMVLEFRKLECNLGFVLRGQALRRINTQRMEIEYVPENDEEREFIAVSGYKVTRGYPEAPLRISGSTLGQVIQDAQKFEDLDVHKAFLHDGMNQFHALQYVAAFYQFYFIVEGLYADGRTSEKEVVRAFADSNEFTTVLEMAVEHFSKENDRHSEVLKRVMQAEKCELTVPGLRTFLFRIRGHLHHYSTRSTKPKGTPFNQREFETVALLGMLIARRAIDVQISRRVALVKPR